MSKGATQETMGIVPILLFIIIAIILFYIINYGIAERIIHYIKFIVTSIEVW
jgi:hypothetical protein